MLEIAGDVARSDPCLWKAGKRFEFDKFFVMPYPKRRMALVLGGGFAGLWSAVGAARKLDQLGVGSDDVAITLVNRDPYHFNVSMRISCPHFFN